MFLGGGSYFFSNADATRSKTIELIVDITQFGGCGIFNAEHLNEW